VNTPTNIVAEIAAGNGLSLAQAAKRFPPYRRGRPCSPSTVFRWCASGVIAPDGRRVRLEAARLNGRYLTSEPAIARFIAAQTPDEESTPRLRKTPARRRREAERARRELDKLRL